MQRGRSLYLPATQQSKYALCAGSIRTQTRMLHAGACTHAPTNIANDHTCAQGMCTCKWTHNARIHAYLHACHVCLLLVHMMRLAGMGKVWPRLAEDLDYTGWMVEQHCHDSEEGLVPRLPRLPRSLPISNFSSPRAIFVNAQVALNLGPQRTTPSWTSGVQQHWSV